jgi:hypothetical protein
MTDQMGSRYKAILISALALTLGTGAAGTACRQYAPDPPKLPDIGVKGEVQSVEPARPGSRAGYLGRVLVVGTKKPGVMLDRALVGVTEKTTIRKVVKGQRRLGSFTDLKKGKMVKAWFTGPIAKSYPAQATASEIVLY